MLQINTPSNHTFGAAISAATGDTASHINAWCHTRLISAATFQKKCSDGINNFVSSSCSCFSPCSVILILKDTIRSPCSNFSLHRGCLHSGASKCCKSTPHPTTPLVPQFQLPQATLPHTSMRDAILVWFQRQLSKRNVLMESTILFHRHINVFLHVPSSWSWKTPSVVPAPIFLCIVVAYTPVNRNAANQHPIQPHLWCRNFSCHRRHCLTHQCVMPYSFDFSGNFPKEMFWWNQQFCFIVMLMFFLHVPSSWSWKTPSVVPAPIFSASWLPTLRCIEMLQINTPSNHTFGAAISAATGDTASHINAWCHTRLISAATVQKKCSDGINNFVSSSC